MGELELATGGNPCSQNRRDSRTKCVHTKLVAAAIRAAIDHEEKRLDETQTGSEAIGQGEEEVCPSWARTEDNLQRKYQSERTATFFEGKDLPVHQTQLWSTLLHLQS